MENKFKITVPKPCHEDWNAMIPSDRGRFCNACTTQVVDFTNMSSDEIRDYLTKNTNVCGRFKNEQLESVIIQIPKNVLFSQVHFHKMFMLALLISMGTSLFSCQNSDGTKQKIETVEVVEEEPRMTLGIILPPKDSIDKSKIKEEDSQLIYRAGDVDFGAKFPNDKFGNFFYSKFKIPEKHKSTPIHMFIKFMIEKDGSLTEIKPLRCEDEEVNLEAIRVVKLSPKWIPGVINGEKVRVSYIFPIHIDPQ